MRLAVRDPAPWPASPRGSRPPDGAVADRVHLQPLDGAARRTAEGLAPAGEVRLGAFTERLLVERVRSGRPRRRRLLPGIARRARVTTTEIPGRERRLPPGAMAGIPAPRGR